MDYLKIFTTDNKSGYKTKEKWVKENLPEVYNIIKDEYSSLDITYKEKIYLFIHGLKNIPSCKNCGKTLKFKKSLVEGYGTYCSIKCANTCEERINKIKESSNYDEILEKTRKTTLERYGVDNLFKDKEYIKEKTIERFGVDHIAKLDIVKENRRKTNLEKYGAVSFILSDEYLKQKHNDSLKKLKETVSSNINEFTYVEGVQKVIYECDKCYESSIIDINTIKVRKQRGVELCTKCNPLEAVPSLEGELYEYIKSIYSSEITQDSKDIIIPEYKLGVCINSLLGKSEEYGCDKNYHLNKTLQMNSKGYKLLHIFEDEWLNKQDIVKSMISSRLGVNNSLYARKCDIRLVGSKESFKFLEDNHLQGGVSSSIRLGLYYNEELVSLMTFGKLRVTTGNKHKEGEYELYRYCNKKFTNVVGGASRLLKYFKDSYSPERILTYANTRYSDGLLYETLGFEFVDRTEPGYFYVKNNTRYHRYNFRKDKLVKEGFDSNKTEYQIMLERGYNKIWDCGNLKYEL